jgi:hypothetical protein
MINKEDILFSKKNKKVLLSKSFISNILSWDHTFNIFKLANEKNKVNFNSFATCTIDKSEQYTNLYDDLIKKISILHPGNKISALSIIHFITKQNKDLNHKNENDFKDYFLSVNPNKLPQEMPPEEAFNPTVHSDPVDGFFIQFQGSTLWKIYYDDKTESHILEGGDMIFIPKNLNHSVESLCPRTAVSISFSDEKA